ncbi:ATP-binding protein [Streptomyces europaeiscabiei]|uniref:ATP-binding protein n=1 Tax=Streptomyces europaeiscabiei TaxID=146819 RepID=UPI0029BA1598|nr:ATP-binding protein [Streptomyces europaeiscabiei]MDX3847865.1 ATP-binding protein [Streptomyces europaeiscabiei]
MSAEQVLLMGVARFASTAATQGEPEPGSIVWRGLPFVPVVMSRLNLAYKSIGYGVVEVADPDRRAVLNESDEAIMSASTRIVHVISHGSVAEDLNRSRAAANPEHIHMVPACGQVGNGTNVSQWVSTAHERPEPTLFIVDLCRAGRAARLSELTRVPDGDRNAWVIAGTSPDLPAYDGRFSEAVAEVLEQIAAHGLDTSPSLRFVRWDRVTRAVQQTLEALGSTQRLHTTPVDVSQELPELPFFPNPRWRHDERLEKLHSVEAPVRAFVADLGAEHFIDRVGDHFVGRRSQLEWLATWLDDHRTGGLRVVTGAPGSGKSALLGALVCAGHEAIISAAPDIRTYLTAQDPDGVCSPNPLLAAIHARGRDLDAILDSLAAQWNLPAEPDRPWTVADLLAEIRALPAVPALIFDALDEAEDPQGLLRSLLLPLAKAIRPDGQPAIRLLVGTRRWGFGTLLDMAGQREGLLDLDDVPPDEVRNDLRSHMLRRLSQLPQYSGPGQRAIRTALADTVAEALTQNPDRMPEWGPFLVARIFGQVLESLPPATEVEGAAALGASVPRSLPAVLELDVGSHPDSRALRAVLAAVAFAKGDGFPTEAIAAVAPEFAPELLTETAKSEPGEDRDRLQRIRALLDAGSFYLRTGVESDGATLYRLFHQGLADYLQDEPYPTDDTARNEDA